MAASLCSAPCSRTYVATYVHTYREIHTCSCLVGKRVYWLIASFLPSARLPIGSAINRCVVGTRPLDIRRKRFALQRRQDRIRSCLRPRARYSSIVDSLRSINENLDRITRLIRYIYIYIYALFLIPSNVPSVLLPFFKLNVARQSLNSTIEFENFHLYVMTKIL